MCPRWRKQFLRHVESERGVGHTTFMQKRTKPGLLDHLLMSCRYRSLPMTADVPDTESSPDATSRPEKSGQRDVVLAIDINGERFEAGLVTARGELIDRASVSVEPDVGPESHYTALAMIVNELSEVAAQHHGVRVRAVGIGCEGPVTRGLETVSPISLPIWRDFPLRGRMEELTELPVFGDLDAKVLALAEGWLGAAQGHPDFCVITVSTSIAGGIVIDGNLLEGESGYAGHVGHMIVEPGGRRCRCGAQGCLDAEASGQAIEAITGRPPSEPTYEIMQRTGRLVGRTAAMICNAFDLTLVVVGGTVASGFGATFFHAAQVALDQDARLAYSRGARITPSKLGETGPIVGAGALGWRGVRRSARASRRQPPNAR